MTTCMFAITVASPAPTRVTAFIQVRRSRAKKKPAIAASIRA